MTAETKGEIWGTIIFFAIALSGMWLLLIPLLAIFLIWVAVKIFS